METDSLPLYGQVFRRGIGVIKLVIFRYKIHTIFTVYILHLYLFS